MKRTPMTQWFVKPKVFKDLDNRWVVCYSTGRHASIYSYNTWAEAIFFATGKEPYKR